MVYVLYAHASRSLLATQSDRYLHVHRYYILYTSVCTHVSDMIVLFSTEVYCYKKLNHFLDINESTLMGAR